MTMTAPETRSSLLVKLREPQDQQAWGEFVEFYLPLILRLAKQRGLQEADAREVAQDVLMAVARSISRFESDPSRGSFRAWISTIARNMTVNFLIRQSRHPRGTGDSDFADRLDDIPAPDGPESQLFDLEHRRQIFAQAVSQIETEFRRDTWRAFWETTVCDRAVAVVSAELKMTIGAIYVARSRVMKRLREKVEEIQRR